MKRFYTLIELIAVIAIGGIMMSAAVPAFSRLMQGSSSGTAVRELTGKIGAARAYAIANRTCTAVVFPMRSELALKNYAFVSYRICEVYDNGGTLQFKRWIPGENWNFLPAGTFVGYKITGNTIDAYNSENEVLFSKSDTTEEQKGTSSEPKEASSLTLTLTADQLEIHGYTNAATLKNMLVFRQDGTLQSMTSTVIPVCEARWQDSAKIRGLKAGYIPLVVRMTGNTRIYQEVVDW